MQTSGDHQVQHEPQLLLQPNGYPFSYSLYFTNGSSFDLRQGRAGCAHEKGTRQSNALELLPEDTLLQRFDVHDHVRQFWHTLPFYTDYLTQRVDDLHKVGLRRHHLI